MKMLKSILCAIALTAAFVGSSRADFIMTASGTAEIQKSFVIGSNTAVTATMAFNNKFIYTAISNAVANATNWAGTAIAPTNLPADGYIAYNPNANDTMITGVFYVTNKSGLYYPLSGIDTNGQYYSWIELDSVNIFFEPHFPVPLVNQRLLLGWVEDGAFNGIASYKLNSKTNGMETAKSTAVFYVHDDPYDYDDENPGTLGNGDNDDANAMEVRGILTATLAVTSTNTTISSLSITGSGNLIYDPGLVYTDTGASLVEAATVKFAR